MVGLTSIYYFNQKKKKKKNQKFYFLKKFDWKYRCVGLVYKGVCGVVIMVILLVCLIYS